MSEQANTAIRICAKYVQSNTHICNLLSWFCTGQDVIHLELGFRRICGGAACEYKQIAGKHVQGITHWVFYTAVMSLRNADQPGVRRAIERDHTQEPGRWLCLELERTVKQDHACEEFMKKQMNSKYDIWRFRSLPLRKLLTFEPLSLISEEEEHKDLEQAKLKETIDKITRQKKSKWICSELIAYALVVAEALNPEENSIEVMTPGDVIDALTLKFGHTSQLKSLTLSEDDRFGASS